jgi:two-component sensor histidine kinase
VPNRDGGESATLALVARLMAVSREVRAHPARMIALALAAFMAGLVLRALADPIIPLGSPYVTFFPAVLISGFLGGLACGVICALLSGFAAWYFFIPPFWTFKLDAASAVAILFYVFVVGVDLTLIQLLYRALEAAARERARLGLALDQQRTLFTELQHRVANNLAFVSALFGLQKRRLGANAQAVAAFDDARRRLDVMARLHRRLYDPANADLSFDTLAREALSDMLDGADRRDVKLKLEIAPTPLSLQRKMTLTLFIVEAATNALKHAFAHGRPGELRVTLEPAGEGRARLTVSDDGPGWPEGGPPVDGRSLGLRILRSFAATARGDIAFGSRSGAAVSVEFAVDEDMPAVEGEA